MAADARLLRKDLEPRPAPRAIVGPIDAAAGARVNNLRSTGISGYGKYVGIEEHPLRGPGPGPARIIRPGRPASRCPRTTCGDRGDRRPPTPPAELLAGAPDLHPLPPAVNSQEGLLLSPHEDPGGMRRTDGDAPDRDRSLRQRNLSPRGASVQGLKKPPSVGFQVPGPRIYPPGILRVLDNRIDDESTAVDSGNDGDPCRPSVRGPEDPPVARAQKDPVGIATINQKRTGISAKGPEAFEARRGCRRSRSGGGIGYKRCGCK